MKNINPPEFNIFARPWRPKCLALIEILALGKVPFENQSIRNRKYYHDHLVRKERHCKNENPFFYLTRPAL